MNRWLGAVLVMVSWTLGAPLAGSLPDQIKSYAVVHDDGTLTVRGWTIRLYGVWLPPSDRQCETRIRPARCGTRAAVALRSKVTGFVDCRPQVAYNDGSIGAVCLSGGGLARDGIDLGAWLIEEGLALARPEAPFSYQALERIARANHRGVWGRFVDDIR